MLTVLDGASESLDTLRPAACAQISGFPWYLCAVYWPDPYCPPPPPPPGKAQVRRGGKGPQQLQKHRKKDATRMRLRRRQNHVSKLIARFSIACCSCLLLVLGLHIQPCPSVIPITLPAARAYQCSDPDCPVRFGVCSDCFNSGVQVHLREGR